jgi:hypothetical protein
MTSAPTASAAASVARRVRQRSRLGLVLAVVALLAQIAGPGLHPAPIGLANGVGKLAIAFDARALCLAPDGAVPNPSAPADQTPKADHGFAACCVWHGSVVAMLGPAVHVEPVAFAASHVAFTAPPAVIPTRLYGAARARAPPLGA